MTQRDVVARLRMMASEREAYTKSGRPMHVNEAMTGWLTEAADEIERLRAAGRKLLSEMWEGEYGDGYTLSARAYKEADAIFNEQSAQPVPDEIRNDPSRCCKGLTPAECSSVPEGECERD